MTEIKSRNYWRKRFEILEESQHKRSVTYYQDVEKAYKQTMLQIEKDITHWYARFADSEGITLQEAKRLLKTDELEEFKWTVHDYIHFGEENALNQQWMKQLENASSRVHISRLEMLKIQMQQHVEKLYNGQIDGFSRFVKDVYQEQYYHTAYEVQKAFNVGFTMQALDEVALNKIINKPWTADKLTFSGKIWRDRSLLVDTLQRELTQAVVRGESPHRVIAIVKKKLDTSRSNAARLVLTEQSFFSATAQRDAFNELDVEKFEVIATLDHKTSTICQDMDGRVFSLVDFEPGITANPFHSRCRTTTAPYFDDGDDYGQRIARGQDGKVYYIPSNIKYSEWKEEYVA